MKLIDKERVVAEIEKRLDKLYNLLPDASKVENGNITIPESCNTGRYMVLESLQEKRLFSDIQKHHGGTTMRENYIKTYQLLLNSFIENSKKESVAKEFRPMFDQLAFQFAKLPIIDCAIEVLENEKYLGFNLGVKGDYIILANKYLDDDDDEVFFSVSYEGDPFIVNSMKVEDLVLTMQEVIQKSVLL